MRVEVEQFERKGERVLKLYLDINVFPELTHCGPQGLVCLYWLLCGLQAPVCKQSVSMYFKWGELEQVCFQFSSVDSLRFAVSHTERKQTYLTT